MVLKWHNEGSNSSKTTGLGLHKHHCVEMTDLIHCIFFCSTSGKSYYLNIQVHFIRMSHMRLSVFKNGFFIWLMLINMSQFYLSFKIEFGVRKEVAWEVTATWDYCLRKYKFLWHLESPHMKKLWFYYSWLHHWEYSFL